MTITKAEELRIHQDAIYFGGAWGTINTEIGTYEL